MRGRILLLIGLAAGYVLGARAGREKYEQIARTAGRLWNDPRVQKQVDHASDYVKDKAPEVKEFVSDNVKKATDVVTDKVAPKSKTPSTRSRSASSADASI
jgi:hypothetical protein